MDGDVVNRWLSSRAVPLPSEPGSTPDVVGSPVAGARVVGLGAAVRHAAATVAAMRAVVVDLVVHHGFRALALEGTETPYATAAALDRYLVAGEGDPAALLAANQGFLRTRELLDVVTLLRARNEARPDDPVRLVHPPVEVPEWRDLAEVERGLADGALTWLKTTGQKIVHWGGAAHVVVGDPRGVPAAGPEQTHRNAGGHLRAALGEGYVAVAATVGAVAARDGVPAVPVVPATFAEAALPSSAGAVWVPLRDPGDVPDEVTAWLDAPLRTRTVGPSYDPAHDAVHHVTAPSVRGAVDAFLHVPYSAADSPL